MILQTEGLFVNLTQDYETQFQEGGGLSNDVEFMRMMNILTANNTNIDIGRLKSFPPIDMNETLSSSDIPNVGNGVPIEPGVNVDETGV